MTSDFDYVRRMTPDDYVFPADRLKRTCDPGRTPLVLVACGSCEFLIWPAGCRPLFFFF